MSLALLIAASGVLVTSLVSAKKMAQVTLAPQVSEIISNQRAMEKKLAAIESKLTSLQAGIRAGAGRFGNMPPTAAQPPAEDPDKVYTINQGSSLIKGNENARVTIVEFSDFQCPYSQKFHSLIGEVLKSYPNDVKFIFKNFPLPFHSQAKPAAKASLAAREQGKYWEMVEALFKAGQEASARPPAPGGEVPSEPQADSIPAGLSEEKFKELAKNIGLDVDKFMSDYKEKDAEWEKLIAEDMDAVRAAEVRGTPTFFLNGKKTRARDLDSFKAEIDKILGGPGGK